MNIERLCAELADPAALEQLRGRSVPPYRARRPAVIAVDLYDLVYDGGPRPVRELMDAYPASCGEFAWRSLPHTVRLYETARKRGVPVVHVTYDTRKETNSRIGPTNRRRRQPDISLYRIKQELTPLEGELVVYKKRASAFFGTPLSALLNEMGVDGLLIAGESTSGCVRSSVVEAWSLGYPVAVVADCVFDRCELSHNASLFDMHAKYADVIGIDAACKLVEETRHA